MPPSAIQSPIPTSPAPAKPARSPRNDSSSTRTTDGPRAATAEPTRTDRAEADRPSFGQRLDEARGAERREERPAPENEPSTTDSAPEDSGSTDAPNTEGGVERGNAPEESEAGDKKSGSVDEAPSDDSEPTEASGDADAAEALSGTVLSTTGAVRADDIESESGQQNSSPREGAAVRTQTKRSETPAPTPQAGSGAASSPNNAPEAEPDAAPQQPQQSRPERAQTAQRPVAAKVDGAAQVDAESPTSRPQVQGERPNAEDARAARADRAVRDAERAFAPVRSEGDAAKDTTSRAVIDIDADAQKQAPRPVDTASARLAPERPAPQPAAPQVTTAPQGEANPNTQTSAPGAIQAARFEERPPDNTGDGEPRRDSSSRKDSQRVDSAATRTADTTQTQTAQQASAAAQDVRTLGDLRASGSAPAAQSGPGGSSGQQGQQAEQAALASANRGLDVALKQQGGSVQLRMNPETLGSLKVELSIAKGVVAATLRASTAEARDLLSRNIDTLRAALEAKGLSVERLSITLAPASQGGSSGHTSTSNGGTQQHHHSTGNGSGQQSADHDAGGERSKGFFERHERHLARNHQAPSSERDDTEERLFRYRFGLHAIG